MHSPISFDQPLVLLLLPAVAVVFWLLTKRSWSGLTPGQIRQSLILRIVVAGLVVLALAGPHLIHWTSQLTTLFVLDVSQSIRPDQRADSLQFIQNALQDRPGGDQAGLVVFGKDPYVEIPPAENSTFRGIHSAVSGDSTNIQAALQVAAAAFPGDTAKRIVIFSDGNENVGDASSEVAALKAHGVQLDIAPSDLSESANSSPEALVDDLILPAHAMQNQPFSIRALVSSNVAQQATLQFKRDGQELTTKKVALNPGKTAVVITEREAKAGFHRYDVNLYAPEDTVARNNQAYGFVSVRGKPRILYVSDSAPSADTLQRAMSVEGIATDIAPPQALSTNVAALETYDSIVFGNVASTEFSPNQLIAVSEVVRDFGVGFGMIGGVHSYAAGSYAGTPIEQILPVSMQIPKTKKLPAADVVIVLDASGSMSATENGVEKVQVAARAAINLMEALQPDDRVAVITVTTTPTLVVPLESPDKAKAARAAIESVEAGGGGIYCLTGLEAAYSLLEAKSTAPIKHVIICPDTTDSEQQEGSIALAAEMRKDQHITTSVCGIGNWGDQHVPYQRALAAAGGGQLFVANQATDLPDYFQRDVQTIQQSFFVEKPFLPAWDASDDVLAGIPFSHEPPLLGYNLTTAKPGADVPLTAPGTHDPIFAHWQYGLGRTFAFTSDDRAHWAAQWLDWPGYMQFWSQVLRWSLRAGENNNLQAVADAQSGKGHLVVDAFADNGGYVNGAAMTAKVVAPDLTMQDVPLAQTGPGRYEAHFDADQTGAYLINVEQASGKPLQTVGLVVPYSPEYRDLGPNLPLLTELSQATGGRLLGNPDQSFRAAPVRVISESALAPALLLLAGLIFLLDIAWRRLGWYFRPRAALEGLRAANGATGSSDAALVMDTAAGRPARTWKMAPLVDDDLLSRPASARTNDEDDPFPFVVSLPRGRRGDPRDDKPG